MSPTLRAAVCVAVLAAAGWFLPSMLVLMAFVVLCALCVVDRWWARRGLEVASSVPEVAVRGRPSTVAVQVGGGSMATVQVRLPSVPDLALDPSVANGGLEARLTPLRRGRHRLGPVVLRSTGPLGLMRVDTTWGPDDYLVRVYPDLPAARRFAHLVRTGRFRDPGQRPRGPLGIGTEFETIRDYQPDDDIRQINWRATQRLQRPMSNQFREDTERIVLCVVDSGRLMAAPVGDATRLDIALDAVAAVVAVADTVGDRSGCIAFAGQVRGEVKPRRSGGRIVVDTLYDLEPVLEDGDYETVFARASGGKRALILVFTDLLDMAAARSLLAAIPTLAARHAVVVASVVDPEIASLASKAPTDVAEAYAMVAAASVLDERARVVAELTRTGATVVEVPVESFSAACVGAYLRLKAMARL